MKRRLLYNGIHKTVSKATCLNLYNPYIQLLNLELKQRNVALNRLRVPLGYDKAVLQNPILVILVINEVPNKLQEHRIGGI